MISQKYQQKIKKDVSCFIKEQGKNIDFLVDMAVDL